MFKHSEFFYSHDFFVCTQIFWEKEKNYGLCKNHFSMLQYDYSHIFILFTHAIKIVLIS
jgi:hypothetical protein